MKLEMTIAENELKMAHRQLEDRLMQSKNILKLLHQTQFEERTEDILEKIHKAAAGKYKMSHLDWKRFPNNLLLEKLLNCFCVSEDEDTFLFTCQENEQNGGKKKRKIYVMERIFKR